MKVVALTADDLLRALHLDTDTRSRNCSATLVRFDPARGVLDFATHCRDSKHTWRQRVRIQDWDLLLESVADVDEEEEEVPVEPEEEEAPVEPEEEEKPSPTAAAVQNPKITSWTQAKADFPEIKEMNVKVSCNCLTGDTRILLLNGNVFTMEEIASRYPDRTDFWVYSADETGNFRPGRAISLGITGLVSEIYEIKLDNDQVIRCTGNHPFMLRDGKYCAASELKVDNSLMALGLNDGKISYPYWTHKHLDSGTHSHNVVSAVKLALSTPIPVYDLSVEVWHNFLVDAGVFVHNCPAFPYWGSGYTVDQLDAGDYSLPRYKNSPAPETRAPNIRDPGLDRTICKHLIAVLRKFFAY